MSDVANEFADILPRISEVYQDVEVSGRVIIQGRRECASRFEFMKPSFRDGQVIIDVGSSLGYFTSRIAREYPSTLVVSFESVPEHCEIQRKIAEREQLFNLVICCHRLSRGDLERWVKCVECIDIVLLLSVLHHFPKDDVMAVFSALRAMSSTVIAEFPNPLEKKICGGNAIGVLGELMIDGAEIGTTKSHLEDIPRSMRLYENHGCRDDLDSYIGAVHDGRHKFSVRRDDGWVINDKQAIQGVNAWNLLHFGVVWPPPKWWVDNALGAYAKLESKSDVRPWNLLMTSNGLVAFDHEEFPEGSPEFFCDGDLTKLEFVFSSMKPLNPWKFMSETRLARKVLGKYCTGLGLDMGFGGDKITPEALSFDTDPPYTHVGGDKQILKGHCRDLGFLCDESLDYIYSSHLLEDFIFPEVEQILREWRRVLKPGGLLVTCCPDQQVYSAHCKRTGQPYNEAHKEDLFSLSTFNEVAMRVGRWETVYENPLVDTYSFHSVLKKIA